MRLDAASRAGWPGGGEGGGNGPPASVGPSDGPATPPQRTAGGLQLRPTPRAAASGSGRPANSRTLSRSLRSLRSMRSASRPRMASCQQSPAAFSAERRDSVRSCSTLASKHILNSLKRCSHCVCKPFTLAVAT
uniref:Uncharacterized protein n=1 Tax=Alexandrium monilatum TaxID=311494 RepID=A0A7S4QR70_9DINO